MKNRILILGNNDFSRECYENGVFKINNKNYIKYLYKEYDVDNFSKENLNCISARCMCRLFCELYKYSKCVISLGIDEIKNNTISSFEYELKELVNYLISRNIEPVLLEIDSDKYNVEEVNSIIRKVCKEYKLKNDLFNNPGSFNPKLQLCH